jgi:hypothetical protein
MKKAPKLYDQTTRINQFLLMNRILSLIAQRKEEFSIRKSAISFAFIALMVKTRSCQFVIFV